ncbi:pilus assembly protein CpaF [Paenibacillus phyllosphaerae]|uniref:Pilus assembly protein CpaF n=1 Tax=Paenibacillus phyllosphaerae TaxID=274593 RepID=A0A7W5B0E2_9BACL|nr:ATPase, T2SS/T4P/T4SS family [Paenibacillus phyllosphaerae]MBB3112155.1 pilus assembly protein CpaF [Paenibacillus phyllosphaerae]
MDKRKERFSPTAFSAQLRMEHAEERAGSGQLEEAQRDFARLAEDIRGYLAMPRGDTEEERRNYNERLNRAVLGYAEEREQLLAIISDRLLRQRIHDVAGYNHSYGSLAEALFAEVIGMSVLELVLQQREGLEEIQVVGTQIYEVRGGTSRRSAYAFDSEREVERIQQNLVLYNNDRINPRKRWAEVMLRDGTRVTMTGFGFTSQPTLTLRFYTVRRFDLAALASPAYGTISEKLRQLLAVVLQARFNLVLIGPTNSGKTHLMKALINELPDEERLITIESRHELMLRRDFPLKNAVEYETDDEDALHGANQAFKLALRQSPERIIHAEIRDDDANIYVRACTRGHQGSMTTVHANALEDVPEAITDMCMQDGRAMNPDRLAKRIAEYVTQIGIEMRIVSGTRKLVRLAELSWSDGTVTVQDWARYDEASGGWVYPHRPSEKAWSRIGASGARYPSTLEEELA